MAEPCVKTSFKREPTSRSFFVRWHQHGQLPSSLGCLPSTVKAPNLSQCKQWDTLTISLKAVSRAPITRHSWEIFFSVKKRVGGEPGEPGGPALPRKEAALVRVLLLAFRLSGSSPRQVGGRTAEFFRMSTMSCSCSAIWCWSSFEATTAAPDPAWPSNKDQ